MSLEKNSIAYTLDAFCAQPALRIENNSILQRQTERESNARSYPRRIPLALKQAYGVYVQDTQGQLFIDCLAGAGTLALGHNHPCTIEAIRQVLDSGLPLHTLDLTTPVKDEFTTVLFDSLPPRLATRGRVHFCGPTGADAIEAALKLVKTATGRRTILCFTGAYHGMTQTTLSMMGNLGPKLPIGTMGSCDVHFLPFPNDQRCPFGIGGEAGIDAGLHYIENIISNPNSGILPPAAVIIEAIQGEGGVIPAPARWLRELRRMTVEHKIPLIIDEVQSGIGRTGAMFAFEHAGIEPDVVVIAKAVGGGLPLAVIVYDQNLDVWAPGAHTGTFRGNQLAMAAGTATLNYIRRENLMAHAASMGDRLMQHLRGMQKKYPMLGQVRGQGLMIGVEIVDPTQGADSRGAFPIAPAFAKVLQQHCIKLGVILELGGTHGGVVRFLPPLIIQAAEIDEVAKRFEQALKNTVAEQIH